MHLFKTYKKSFLAVFLFLLLGSIGWGVLFQYGINWLKKEVALAEMNLKQKGYELSYSSLAFQGNPFSLTVVLHNPHFKDPDGFFDLKGSEMTVSIRPWNWRTVSFTLPYDQKISTKYSSLGTLSVEGATGTLHLTSKGEPDYVSLSSKKLSSLRDAHPHPIFLSTLSLTIKNLMSPLTLQVSGTCLVKGVETFLKEPPSSEALSFSLEAHLSGFQGKTAFPASFAEWRDGGGVLDVDLLKLEWLPLSMTGDGTLTFDKDMYLLGAFKSRIVGYKKALDHLVEVGIVKQKSATMVTFILDILSRSDKKGEKYIDIPITLQDRKISVGAIPLFKME